jgi:hypothetical protein
MTITSQLFEAFVKCPTKCWLKHSGENGMGNAYAAWVHTLLDSTSAVIEGAFEKSK